MLLLEVCVSINKDQQLLLNRDRLSSCNCDGRQHLSSVTDVGKLLPGLKMYLLCLGKVASTNTIIFV